MAFSRPDVDVAVIGGGPAGAAMAAYLAGAGVDCIVLEGELFPRPHVGESLVPSSTRVFKDLGFLEEMERQKFPHKYGAAWTAASSNGQYEHGWDGLAPDQFVDVDFAERHQPGVDLKYTYHVDRAKFDLALLQHAEKRGAKVCEGVHVRGVDFSHDHVDLKFSLGRKACSVSAYMVVDASGRRTLLGNQMKWKINDPVFDQYAIHTWFQDYDRKLATGDVKKAGYIFIHFLPMTNSWVWQIPITDDITSIGVVTQKMRFKEQARSLDQFFWDCLSSRPDFLEAARNAVQLRPLKAEGDYSYAMKRITADRAMLIGDAARFVDPIFSTGVSIALNSARFGSADVLRSLTKGDFSAASFGDYEATIRRGTKNWHEFISLYYRLNVLFTAFIRDPRYRLDVLKLLQGDVYDDDSPEVLSKMRGIVDSVERNPDHVWHDMLNDLTANAFTPSF